MAPTAWAQAQNAPIQLSPSDPLGQRQGPGGGSVLPCLETADAHQLILLGKRLCAKPGAAADAGLMVVRPPS